MKKIIVIFTVLMLILSIISTNIQAGTKVLTRIRPMDNYDNPLNVAAIFAAKQSIDSVWGSNSFVFPGVMLRTFNPDFIVVQNSPNDFRVTGMFYEPNYRLMVHTNDGGKILAAIAGAAIGAAVGGEKAWKSGALIGATTGTLVGSVVDMHSAELSVSGAYIFHINLQYTHSMDSLHFTSLWTCTDIQIDPVRSPAEMLGEKIEVSPQAIKDMDILANRWWVQSMELKTKALKLKADADALRGKK